MLIRYRQCQKLLFPLQRNSNVRRYTGSKPRSFGKEKAKQLSPPSPDNSDSFGLTSHAGRLALAFGLVYVFNEYFLELTICEGPSMIPTIRPRGEIVLLDRCTPQWFGLHHGTNGQERGRLARQLQNKLGNNNAWYEAKIPVNQLPREHAWDRFVQQISTPVSVGDVVVVQHPDRVGTVCKRVLALPGDIVTKPTSRRAANKRLDLSQGHLIVPDGHIWLEGDNPWNSSDSRNYGPVPASLIVGRVLLRVWPLRGNAMMERGARPLHDNEEPELSFSGSVAFPAGYDNQTIIRDYETFRTTFYKRQD